MNVVGANLMLTYTQSWERKESVQNFSIEMITFCDENEESLN